MTIDELPSIARLKDEINKLETLLRFNAVAGGVLIPGPQAKQLASKLSDLEAQMQAYTSVFVTFDRNFSERGWIVHDLMNFPMMETANRTFSTDGIESAETVIVQQYAPEKIERMLPFLLAVPELVARDRFIRQAFEDYKNGRFISCIPILLMMIDGAVNDFVGHGLHSQEIELDAWDSIASVNEGMSRMHRIFITGRRKTHEEQISMPYRNGILHGMDLGYDNPTVAAKCWHYLFVVRDWIHAKRTEADRMAKSKKDAEVPPLHEVLNKIDRTDRIKEIMAAWKPRQNLDEYISGLNAGKPPESSTAEATAIEYLGYWKARNYGFMEKITWQVLTAGSSYVDHIKQTFRNKKLLSYQILQIREEAPVITEVDIDAILSDSEREQYTIRLTYVREDSDLTVPKIGDGMWRVVSCHQRQAT